MKKRGQVTIFVILAIIIVVGVVVYFSIRGGFTRSVPAELSPVYDYYLSCLEEASRQGVNLLGEQAGYIKTPEFVPGSSYMPFSSQLDFFGEGVPYWMYVSGNNILREQVPSKSDMEKELGVYVGDRVVDCDFSDFELAGFDVYLENGKADVSISDNQVLIELNSPLVIHKGEVSASLSRHSIELNSKLGKFYGLAREVYDYEKSEAFLEKYALDVMRLYAPTTGTEIGCTPKIFVDEEIGSDIVEGLSQNIPTLKLSGDYYALSSKERDYFVSDSGFEIDENVNFMYDPTWPTGIEIYGDKVAKPVGLQEGFGVLGFCYVPYHLVYDINFPVMIQFFDDEELFQFPVAVVIQKSSAREAIPTDAGSSIESEVCKFKESNVRVSTYDWNFNPVEANIEFKCLNSFCEIGETSVQGREAFLEGEFPSCVNGFIVASAPGYAETKYQISTNSENVANIILRKKYKMNLDLGNVERAIVSFESSDYSATAVYPEMKTVELIEGDYNVSVKVYDDSSIKFPAVNRRECVDVPEDGLAGFLGAESEKCYDIKIPETEAAFAVVGGGKTREYVTEGQLIDSSEININVPLFGLPLSMDEMQENYIKSDDEVVYISYE